METRRKICARKSFSAGKVTQSEMLSAVRVGKEFQGNFSHGKFTRKYLFWRERSAVTPAGAF